MKKLILYLFFAFSAIISMAQTRFEVDGLTYEILSESDRTVEVHDYDKRASEISIPKIVFYNRMPYTVTAIGDKAFEWCFDLTSVIIPNTVTTIGNEAFHLCHGLTSIIIPNSVITIGESAFATCNGLTSVTIGNSVTTIGNKAFWLCI